jgi:hypothetical protein
MQNVFGRLPQHYVLIVRAANTRTPLLTSSTVGIPLFSNSPVTSTGLHVPEELVPGSSLVCGGPDQYNPLRVKE